VNATVYLPSGNVIMSYPPKAALKTASTDFLRSALRSDIIRAGYASPRTTLPKRNGTSMISTYNMVKQICAKPSVDCKCEKAVKYFDNNFSMGNKELGRLSFGRMKR
jgi:hypothetical protein